MLYQRASGLRFESHHEYRLYLLSDVCAFRQFFQDIAGAICSLNIFMFNALGN